MMYANGMYGDEKMDADDKKAYGGSMKMKYRAEQDVMALHEAMEIKEDDKRYKMAMHCAKRKAEEMNEVAYMTSHLGGSHMEDDYMDGKNMKRKKKRSHNPGNHSRSRY